MRLVALTLVLVVGTARADAPPSPTLERAIKLYDKADYWSASIELGKVRHGESGDDAANQQRAQFFAAKVTFQLGFYAAALAALDAITREPTHRYRLAAWKWIAGALAKVEALRLPMATLTPADTDDPSLGSVADPLRWFGGLAALDAHDEAGARALLERVAPSSTYHAAAQAELARLELAVAIATNDQRPHDAATDALFAVASGADRGRGRDAIRQLAAVASSPAMRASRERVRGQLGELTRRDPSAAFAVSWLAVLDHPELAPLAKLDVAVLEAVATEAACLHADLVPTAHTLRDRVGSLVVVDPAELDHRLAGDPAIAAMIETRAIRDARARQLEVTSELARISQTAKAWQTTQVAAELLQELTIESSLGQSNVGELEHKGLVAAAAQLDTLERLATTLGPIHGLDATCGAMTATVTAPQLDGPHRMPVVERRGCAGCASGGDGGLALGLLAFRRRRRAARAR